MLDLIANSTKSRMPSQFEFDPNSRFVSVMHVAIFLISIQASIAFFLNDTDIKQALIVNMLTLLLLFFSTAVFIHRKTLSINKPLVLFLTWGAVAAYWSWWLLSFGTLSGANSLDLYDLRSLLICITRVLVREAPFLCLLQLVTSMVLIFLSRNPESKKERGFGPFLISLNCALIILATLAEATFIAGSNTEYLSIGTIPLYYAFLIAFAVILYCVIQLLWKGVMSSEDIAAIVSVFMAIFIINPTLQAYFKLFNATTRVFAIVFLPASICLALKKISAKRLFVIFAALALLSLLNLAFLMSAAKQGVETTSTRGGDEFSNLVKIDEEERVSVFFLVYDSIPDLGTLGNLGIDYKPLEELLRSKGFKIYEDTYSIRNDSRESMSRCYDISDQERLSVIQVNEICAGKGKAFRIFASNNYSTCSIQSPYMTGGAMHTDEHWPPIEMQYAYSINSLFILLKGIFMGEFKFDIEALKPYEELTYHSFLREEAARKEGFGLTVMHVNKPKHSQNSGELLPNETELFKERFENAIPFIEDDVKTIISNNPSAIIIVLGDHGPFLTGDGTQLFDYSKEDITELMIRDRFGTLIAIRWPDLERAEKYDRELLVNQDIFPVIFAYLADSEEPLSLMIKDKKAVMKNHTYLDNGEFVPFK